MVVWAGDWKGRSRCTGGRCWRGCRGMDKMGRSRMSGGIQSFRFLGREEGAKLEGRRSSCEDLQRNSEDLFLEGLERVRLTWI